ncbi:ATP-dependent zinc metalloprotease FTSH 12, chloroplastic-like [Carica papaya]|uniref:ATP-dependent zinc metalloprotease FTSH 12, chloroplastic-like n=1 Tax=Carica papaya TaxID=3649 RepID=UPI000B8CF8C3|nr:ATP-dependent zinc metalloprotease FTSH 12, chloroplastic-like [Carica papaya]
MKWGGNWIVGDDFNMVLGKGERSGNNISTFEMDKFKDEVYRLEVIDLSLFGGWSKMGSEKKAVKFDYIMGKINELDSKEESGGLNDVERERRLVFRTVGFSGADIRNLVNEAAIMSVRKGHSKIYQQDIVDVLDKQLLEGMGVLLTEEEQQKCEQSVSYEKRRLLAVHEAGHILLAHLFPRFDWHAFSQLLPGGKETAISVFYPREDMVDQGYTTFGYMKMQMVVAHGGRCAEQIVFGDDITDGGRDDLEKITKIAREMVISPQNARLGLTPLTKRIGLLDRPDNADEEMIRYRWDDPQVIPANMTVEVSELLTRELTRYIEESEDFAINGLMANQHVLDWIVSELLEKSRITGLEVEAKMKELSPILFEDFVKPFQINMEEEGPLPRNDRLRYQPLEVYPAPLHRC